MRIFSLFLMLIAASAGAQFYQPPLLNARWHLHTGALECRLIQEIPHLGRVWLVQEAGQPLRFVLNLTPRVEIADASLRVEPAPWQHRFSPSNAYPVSRLGQDGAPRRLEVRGEVADRMLAALYAGHFPVFTLHKPWQGGLSEDRVSVSPVRFWENYDRFQNCRMTLPDFGPRDFENLRFYFLPHQAGLPGELEILMPRMARYLELLGKGRVVVSNATAGVAGREGRRWFQKRFAAIKSRLRRLGLSGSRIASRSTSGKHVIDLTLFGPEGLLLYHYGRQQKSLRGEQKRRLLSLAQYVRDYFPGKVVIHGHSDGARWRSEKTNRALAARWARRVRDFLVAAGVGPDRLEIRVWGSRKRVASNHSRAGQAKNRRVRIELMNAPVLTAELDQSG